MESQNGVSILVHLAKDCPREDVSVYVVTTTSVSSLPLSDYLFQVVVPKVRIFRFCYNNYNYSVHLFLKRRIF